MTSKSLRLERPIYTYAGLTPLLVDLKTQLESQNVGSGSFTMIATELGLRSRTQARKIFKGEMALPKHAAEKLAEWWNLSSTERDYLDMLRKFDQILDADEALVLYRKLLRMRKQHLTQKDTHHSLNELQIEILSDWYTLPVLYYFDLKNASSDPLEISKSFHGQISPDDAQTAILKLASLELIRQVNGRWMKTSDHISILDHLPRPIVRRFHKMMILKALDQVDAPVDSRFLMSATLPIDSEKHVILKKRISDFFVALSEEFSEPSGNELQQVNLQLFRMATSA